MFKVIIPIPKSKVTTVSVIRGLANTSAYTSIALGMAHKGVQVMQEGRCLAEHVKLTMLTLYPIIVVMSMLMLA